MTDPTAIAGAIQALKAASDMIKGIRGADLSLEKAELKIRLAGLAEQLVNARVAVVDTQQLIIELEAKVRELESTRDLADRLVFEENTYWMKDANGKAMAYCPRCYDADGKLVHLSELPPAFREAAHFTCANCRGTF